MSYTCRELVDKAYEDYLGDDKHQSWKDETLLQFLNEGYKELAQRTKFTQKQTIYDFLAGTINPYSLPQDLIEINFFAENGAKRNIEVERISSENIEDQDKILLIGLGEFIYSNSVKTEAILTYWNEPPRLLITDSPLIPSTYSLALVDYVAYRAYMKDQSTESLEKAQMFYSKFLKKSDQLADTAFKSMQQHPLKTSYQGF